MKKSILGLAVVSAIPMFSTNVIAADEAAQSIEKIQVTGSRIKRSDMENASPVTLIGADDIKAMGATSIDSVLQKMTATGGAMTNPGVNNGSGGNARIDLRGLGANRTLVLVNGRRMIASGTGAASTVDLNTIPVSMIKSVEVLKDGASAVYGTDAVAGVVNIILKDDFEGLDMNVNSAITGEGDASETSFDFTVGTSFDKGNIVIGMQYTDRGEASQGDRDFSNCPIAEDANGLNCNGGSVYAEGGHIWQDSSTTALNDKGEEISVGLAQGDKGLSGLGGLHPFTDADRFNFAPSSYLYTPMERLNLTGLATYEISDETRVFTEFTYTKRWSQQQMAPQPVWFGFKYDESMGDSLLDQSYTSKVDLDGDGYADKDADGKYITQSANYKYGDDIFYGRRMSDTGARFFEQSVDTVRAVIGADGYVGDYSWDVSANFGRNDSVDKLSNLHNMGAIGDSIMYTNDENEVVGTFNPLDQAAWTSEGFRRNVYTEVNNGGSQLFILAASVSGEMFELPAGYAAFAAGVERRQEKAWYTPDSLTAQGLANDPMVEPTAGGFDVNEAYVEFALPLLADAPLAQNVELSAAIRAFDYSTFGSDETWKLGLTWKVNDELMLRSVVSTAFRAPTVSELYSGNSPSFEQVEFPGAQDQAEVTVGGNDQLTPEQADTLTAGIVYEPQWFEGFSMTLDYYDIEIENAIATVDNQYIVDQCLVTSDNAGSALCQSSNVKLDSTGRITFNNQLQNIGSEKTSGIDLNLSYSFEAAGLNWKAGLDTTYLDEYVVEVTGDPVDYAGVITSGSGGYADFKSNLTINVAGDNWDAQYQARYIAGMDSYACIGKEDSCYAPTTPTVVYHDISGSYLVNETISLSAGVNNLFDKQPPYYTGNNDSNTDPYTYDVLGRRFFAGVNVKF
ncbi:TonB-dependent receptor plug domain-containing protein [Pseudoalteromonas sp. H105]|uniref:TonB-dependent receptor plug domain-containing protein n=1 Tax=Pseudoalteromonas sp. H105 TaxID=1348393 RepID=UPI0007320482|nr:TonB-dependent receptor [Pseudoalteromonas sp. H105]KTF18457.1 TonB-dependent receptor [Pseudoalteromonas sp. H105]